MLFNGGQPTIVGLKRPLRRIRAGRRRGPQASQPGQLLMKSRPCRVWRAPGGDTGRAMDAGMTTEAMA
jgi:hypothetical protein